MLRNSINKYYNTLGKLTQSDGSKNETTIRRAFAELLQDYANRKELQLVEETPYKTTRIRPDGTLRTSLRFDWGCWESKDTKDDLDTEVKKKIAKGYPTFNMLFENSETAILYQDGRESMRVDMKNDTKLDQILSSFIAYEPQEYKDFKQAIAKFKEDVPRIAETLHKMQEEQYLLNLNYKTSFDSYFELCQQSINKDITKGDIIEMILQHILTADIFQNVFGDNQFHLENNIAKELQKVIDTFFTREIKFNLLSNINHYYELIKAKAAQIDDHHEKQKFLKSVYENFYKSYNTKGADKLGIVYTPNEIVKFMIDNTDYLLDKYYKKTLSDNDVEILDPATGTGTFICDLIEHIPHHKLEYKFQNEIHANEVSILPYYIANLNIEYTYRQKMKKYVPFNHLCFVDTLDNMGFDYKNKQKNLYSLSIENLERIKNQNSKKISVVIGNPPYNASQKNENENNKNKTYYELDKQIEKTYVHFSKAQKTKVYEPYTRFFRWASDRINNKGLISFITNNSFLTAKGFDGFRYSLTKEFNQIYIVDLGGNINAKSDKNLKTGNVFNIKVGVCITFLLRTDNFNSENNTCEVYYFPVSDELTGVEKLAYLMDNKLSNIPFKRIRPDNENNWLYDADSNDFNALLPLCNVSTKNAKFKIEENAIFKLFSNGVATNRDEWVYDFDKKNLENKSKYFIDTYNSLLKQKDYNWGNEIKWSRDLKKKFSANNKIPKYNKSKIIELYNRPFVKYLCYSEKMMNDVLTQNHYSQSGSSLKSDNKVLAITELYNTSSSQVLMIDKICNKNIVYPVPYSSCCLSLFTYTSLGQKKDNITDWGLKQFQNHYHNKDITKENIFHYIYAILHNPSYRVKYELNLKREIPRIPFYADFDTMTDLGGELAELHLNYESAKPYDLQIVENEKQIENPETKLKARKEDGEIVIDENTTLKQIPKEVWDYKIGSHSAVEWILDQYKEKDLRDDILAEKFNTYKFSDYKQVVIDLIRKICTISIETNRIVQKIGNCK